MKGELSNEYIEGVLALAGTIVFVGSSLMGPVQYLYSFGETYQRVLMALPFAIQSAVSASLLVLLIKYPRNYLVNFVITIAITIYLGWAVYEILDMFRESHELYEVRIFTSITLAPKVIISILVLLCSIIHLRRLDRTSRWR